VRGPAREGGFYRDSIGLEHLILCLSTSSFYFVSACWKNRDFLPSLGEERAAKSAKRAFQTFMASTDDRLGYESLIDYAWLSDLLADEELYGLLASVTSRCFVDMVGEPDARRLGECCALILVHSGEACWERTLWAIARQVESVGILNFLRDLLEG
jgi:hypothetical protein